MNLLSTIREKVSAASAWLDQSPLRYWTFHVCVSAAPSFAFSLSLGTHGARIAGMVLGILFFIALYTLSARWTCPRVEELPLWRRAIRLGTWIRTTSSLLVWLGLLFAGWAPLNPFLWLFAPDMYAGFAAHWAVEQLMGVEFGHAVRAEMGATVLFTFLVTITEGFLLSGMLFCVAFCCLWVLKFRARRAAKSSGLPASVRET
jgi:hypothetical protein